MTATTTTTTTGLPGPAPRAAAFEAMPRPRAHPLFGHLHEWVGKENATRVLQTLLGYAEQTGGLARIPLGPARLVLLSDPEPIRQLLTAEDANVKGWPYVLTRVVLDNVLLLNGPPWARARSAYRRALKAAEPAPFCDAALERAWAGRPEDEELELGRWTRDLCADLVVGMLCSARWDPALEPHRERVQYELAAVGIDLQCQPWAYLSPARWVGMRRSVAAMRAFFAERVQERLETRAERADVLEGFLRAAEAGEHSSELEALRDGLVNFFFTAHDVLASSAAWCLWLLAQHPEAQQVVRRGGPDELGCAVRESLRLHPGYPLFSRRTRREVTVAGHRIPASTDVIVSPWVLHRLERHWPGAGSFRPERWRGRLEPVRPGPRGAYMPFGGGYRGCIASAMAVPLLERVVASVLAERELSARPGHEPDLVYWGSTSSANGLPVRVRRI